MLEEPYRWVEAVRNRREFLEDQLQSAAPVIGIRYDNGVLLLTSTPGPRKIFEIYNQVAFAAIGHPADIEKLRKAVIDIAHVEAFNYSSSDISLQRLVSFGLGPLIKSAFDEIFRSPYTARGLMAELDPPNEQDALYMVDADGSFSSDPQRAAVAGSADAAAAIINHLKDADTSLSLADGIQVALKGWAVGRLVGGGKNEEEIQDQNVVDCLKEELPQSRIEAAVLDRTLPGKTKFRSLSPAEVETAILAFS